MADDTASVTRVPATLDLPDAAALRVQVLAGAVRLDWSDVEEAQPAALRLLLQGLDLDEHAHALGLASMDEDPRAPRRRPSSPSHPRHRRRSSRRSPMS